MQAFFRSLKSFFTLLFFHNLLFCCLAFFSSLFSFQGAVRLFSEPCAAWRRLIHFPRPPSPPRDKAQRSGFVSIHDEQRNGTDTRRQAGGVECSLRGVVGPSGLEPPTSRLSVVRSNQLSYGPLLVEISGLEPLTPCLQSRCSPS